MRRKISFHPFLFALYPVLRFWGLNRAETYLQDTWRTIIFCLVAAGILYLVAMWFSRDGEKSALFSALCVVTFFYFGHIYYSIEGRIPYLGQIVFFLIAWLVFFLSCLYLIFRLCRKCESLNTYLNTVSFVLILFPVVQLIWPPRLPSPVNHSTVSPFNNQTEKNDGSESLPDIYYIILDGYGRSDILREFFTLDNSGFLDVLQQRDFYIADQSNTNYTQTFLSMSSSMTGDYLATAGIDPQSEDRRIIQQYLDQNSYIHRFNRMGYETVTMTGSSPIDFNFANRSLAVRPALNDFELGFQSLTIARVWSRTAYEYVHWEVLQSELDLLEQLPFNPDHPQFVFAHLMAPHPPFVFDASGNFIPQNSFMAGDASHYKGTRDKYIRGYSLKVQYLNTRVIEIVDHLLTNPYRPVVIILQADHGPGSYWDFENLEGSCLRERLPIFNAYYIPYENAREKLYPSISPVNSFRLIFDQVLDQPASLLDDLSYSSTWSQPYDFRDVSSQRETCSPIP